MNAPRYLILVFAGLVTTVWGLPASHRLTATRSVLAACAVLVGVILLMLGALLTVLPRFFLE